jgi:DNA modification methylase
MTWEIRQGNALDRLRVMPDGTIQTCVTSPPYFGLRDYGTAKWEGGNESCDHKGEPMRTRAYVNTNCGTGNDVKNAEGHQFFRETCGKCSARRIDTQIGLEQTPDEYVARLVEVFREVRRTLRDDGTLWLNLGDSYVASKTGNPFASSTLQGGLSTQGDCARRPDKKPTGDLKTKDLIGIPWMVAFALRADGWYLRQEIIWHKPNPMPESVTDRCTKSHEQIFLLSKSPRYYFDSEAIAEPSCVGDNGSQFTTGKTAHGKHNLGQKERPQARRVRELAAEHGLTDEHLAAIRAVGITDAGKAQITQTGFTKNTARMMELAAVAKAALGGYYREFLIATSRNKRSVWTVSTKPYKEAHFATFPEDLIEPCIFAGSKEGDIVLDPFNGAASTGLVATKYGRNYIGIELNPEYVEMSERRLSSVMPLFEGVA